MSVFERIKKLAQKRGLSLQRVAEDNNFSQNLIYRWKKSDPKASDLAKIADYFNVSVDYLIGRDSDDDDGISWTDLDMPYGGKVPDSLKGYYRAIAEQYVKEHPDKFKK